ncbi:beta-ketoacyl synthase N-terminal-like domain-containing protein [Neosynechococcus sphagnicola]|uniref:beta-ketoacyl synthase N-terminal-like domain-containing protein n=1 Tax=Neosynechococcus sphagnicola TaxID=1501145 RepID=UPI001EF9EA04|nr:beta-ketoacyl synthase N-terminal-like domain-containing protein [Neosynechococcus sphagnicola]
MGSSRHHQAKWEYWAQRFHQGDWESAFSGQWLEALPQATAMTVAHGIASTAPVLSPMAACATGLWAIAQGYELLQTQVCQRVIVGAIEAPITALTLGGFAQMGALAQTGAFPFDRNREGLVLGEGGSSFGSGNRDPRQPPSGSDLRTDSRVWSDQ